MATVTGLTAARMLAIEAASVVGGTISVDNLILTKKDGSTINAGNVRGPQGIQGPPGTMSSASAGGDLAGSTYPNPVIAPLVVTTGKIADGAITTAKIADGSITDVDVNSLNKDGAATKASMRTLGTGSAQAAPGNHEHATAILNRVPTAVQTLLGTGSSLVNILVDGDDGPALAGFTANADGTFTCNVAGLYSLSGSVSFASNATGRRVAGVFINGTAYMRNDVTPGQTGTQTVPLAVRLARLVVGDVIELRGFQSSGVNLNTVLSSQTYFTAYRISS